MGYEAVELRAYARVSKHNSPRDDTDAAEWNSFIREVQELAEQFELFIDVSASEMPIYGWQE